MESKWKVGEILFWAMLVLFFVSSLILFVGVPDMYNSPDERAMAESIMSFIRDNTFLLKESSNLELGGLLAPRSMVAIGSALVPVTFPGMPLLYGLLGKIISFPLVKLITPLLATLAVFAWRKTLEKIISHRAALIGAVLLMLLAGFWFYTARAFMPNIPFLSLCIFGLYFLSRKKPRVCLAGLMIGLALLFRASEVIWMVIAGVVLFAYFYKSFGWKNLIKFVVGALVGFLPFFFWNSAVFGDALQIGYTASESVSSVSSVSSPTSWVQSISELVFPFGFHPRLAWHNFFNYQVVLTWWMTVLAVLGLPLMWFSKSRALKAIVVATFFAGVYLTFFYGSWSIVDNPDPNAVTLANSYIRYWLPIFLVSTIPAALYIEWLASKKKTLIAQRAFIGLMILIVGLLSARLVFFHPDDGLVQTRAVLIENVETRDKIVSLTEYDSVIVVDHADKIIFPHRRVVVPLRSDSTHDALPDIASSYPLYYFGLTLPEQDLEHLRSIILELRELTIEPVETIGIETLYQFSEL